MATRDPYPLAQELFLAADHDVATEVGAEPGTVVRTARPREGLVRPKIAWVLWSEWPAVLDDAFAALEKLRGDAGADRAIGMVDGSLPEGQAGAVKRGALDVMTLRRFAFQLANVDEHLAELRVHCDQVLLEGFVPRLVEREDGETMDGVKAVLDWCERAAPDALLWLVGPEGSGRSTMMSVVAASVIEQFHRAPDATRPILSLAAYRRGPLAELLRDQGWVILADTTNESADELVALFKDWTGRILQRSALTKEELPPEERGSSTIFRMVELRPQEVTVWLGKQAPARAAALSRLAMLVPDFGSLLVAPRALKRWAAVLKSAWPDDVAGDSEIMAVLVANLLSFMTGDVQEDPVLEWALEDFAMGRLSRPDSPGERSSALEHLGKTFGWSPLRGTRFQNTLLRDYFLAHKIIADVRAGRREILTRHQFPRQFVLLFLAILSPEVAALASEDRSKVVRDEIAAEVEREVQLALAHNLKHPTAMIRGALNDARKKLSAQEGELLASELASIEDATRYIATLVEKTSQWSQIPEETPVPLALGRMVEHALTPLRREWPEVTVTVEIDDTLHVRASPVVLQTILSNLLENAFQAVGSNGLERSITIRARRTGETLRTEVSDTGPGVHADDRERIFRPRVTTKRGGRGRPRGTGMGLPIARKYAEHIGGKVWLDTEASRTTFVLELVPARETNHDH